MPLENNAGNIEVDNTLQQSSNYCMKTSATENEFKKVKNSQPQIENPDNTENKIKI